MKLTVGKLREIIKDLPDDIVLATLDYGNANFTTFDGIKRVLLLKSKESGKSYLTINNMGSHFTGKGTQEGLEYDNKHWD